MDKTKKRVKWFINLYGYKMRDDIHQEKKCPRAMLQGNIGIVKLAKIVEERMGMYKTHEVRAMIGILTDIMEDYLVDG